MSALDELRALANSTSRPDDAAAFILCTLEDLIKREELEQHLRPSPVERYPIKF